MDSKWNQITLMYNYATFHLHISENFFFLNSELVCDLKPKQPLNLSPFNLHSRAHFQEEFKLCLAVCLEFTFRL